MKRRVTGSVAHRVWQCPASWSLPQTVDEEAEARTAAARERGSGTHGFLEAAQLEGFDRAAELGKLSKEAAALCGALDLAELPRGVSSEVAFAWDWRTHSARELGRNLGHRDYDSLPNPPTDDETPFTVDVCGVDPATNIGYAGDYKTGHMRYPRPGDFGQTLLGGLALRSIYGCDEVQLEIIRIDDGGDAIVVRDLVNGWHLDAFAYSLAESMEAATSPSGPPVTNPGPHCLHCNAFRACPRQATLIQEVPAELVRMGVSVTPAGSELDTRLITAAKAAALWVAAERVEAMMGKVKQEIAALAWHHPIDLGDGRVLEPHETTRRAVDPKIAAQVLEERFGREAAMEAMDLSTSFSALRRVAVAHKPDGAKISSKKGGGVLDAIEAEIERRGGIEKKTSTTCKPHAVGSRRITDGQ